MLHITYILSKISRKLHTKACANATKEPKSSENNSETPRSSQSGLE